MINYLAKTASFTTSISLRIIFSIWVKREVDCLYNLEAYMLEAIFNFLKIVQKKKLFRNSKSKL